MKYARVTINGERRSFFLRITAESDAVIVGVEIDKHDSEIVPAGRDPETGRRYTDRVRIIDKTCARIVEHEMNRKYAELEPSTR